MPHQIITVMPIPAPGPGGLPGYAAICTCGSHITSSLETLARQWGWQHADYYNRKEGNA